jgi:hypothetical protein
MNVLFPICYSLFQVPTEMPRLHISTQRLLLYPHPVSFARCRINLLTLLLFTIRPIGRAWSIIPGLAFVFIFTIHEFPSHSPFHIQNPEYICNC